jgi:hypothetical protein
MSDASPSLWDVMAVDPGIGVDRDVLHLVIADQRSRSRVFLYPWVRVLSRVTVTLIVAAKRICPVRFSAHATMDTLCLWFLRRFVSTTAVTLLIRHFIVETNLLNFCLRNAGLHGSPQVALRPSTLAGLGDRAVIEHDLNVYRVLHQLGSASLAPISGRNGDGGPRARAELDFGTLDIPPIDPEPHRPRLLRLDIQTALCLMNIPFALCLTPGEYRRAVHSMRLDFSLLTVLAALTGDATFLTWRPPSLPVRVDSNADVPQMVYEHAVICEHAHARLHQLAAATDGVQGVGMGSRPAAGAGRAVAVSRCGGAVSSRTGR